MQINIFKTDNKKKIDRRYITHLIKKVLKKERYNLNNLNIIIADDKYLRALNKKFFKKNHPTNVISFNMEEVSEIYVSQERAKDNEELYYYIIHGLLHIIGYDHRNKKEELLMGNKCCEYLNNPKEKN